jgi:thiol-disulfide isomerase/thioredoxin
MRKLLFAGIFAAVLAVIFLSGCTQPPADNQNCTITNPDIKTFACVNGTVEAMDGKPEIRLFSTTWCPHCIWIKPTFDRVAKEYVDAGKIVAHHWELDTGDDTLTNETETSVPASEQAVFAKFNPRNSIPTFVFGGKYWRIGNGYEQQQSLTLEEQEFRAVIDELIKEAQGQSA